MLILAIALLILTGAAHSYLGERYILIRLFKRAELPKVLGSSAFTKGTLRFVWHLLTVVWLGIAWLLLKSGEGQFDTQLFLRTIAVVAAVSGLFPLVFTRGKHLSWIVFFIVAGLLWSTAAS